MNQATVRAGLSKVPRASAYFWLIKVLSTTLGETLADWLNSTFNLGLTGTTVVCAFVLAALLVRQFRARRYQPFRYWPTVLMVSVAGTLVTDTLTDQFGVSLYASTALFAALLAVVFVLWWHKERTLDIASINTRSRETWYWSAILVTFALGTAAGDLVTEEWGLGYAGGISLFAALLVACFIVYKLAFAQTAVFWAAYVLSRPLGACLGDLLTAPRRVSADVDFTGWGWSGAGVNALFLAVVLSVVAYLHRNPVDRVD